MFQTTNQMQYLGTVLSFDGLDICIDGFLESIPTYPMHKPVWKVHVPRSCWNSFWENHKSQSHGFQGQTAKTQTQTSQNRR